ncbi:uncharacterized protein LOC129593783 [Paramacrobiotus metropolitanus]|uniref:uncharacterized protein LOC129593783 n=1 Tax=Paramacrobiotus metropolitanus TaxID=2943436 RepID=UPI0024461534|nr:uncharacterized protein LOC129593783 [Paramacrobiotus metropolitanus]
MSVVRTRSRTYSCFRYIMPPWSSAAINCLSQYRKKKRLRSENVLNIFAQWQSRLDEIEKILQDSLNQDFTDGKFTKNFKFAPGDSVLVLSNSGLYFAGRVARVFGVAVPESLYGGDKQTFSSLPINHWVATMAVRFDGYGPRWHEVHAENEIILRQPSCLTNTLGMLFAHEFNTSRCMKYQCINKEMGEGTWFLEDEVYKWLESLWQQETGEVVTFATYSGRAQAESALSHLAVH